MEGQVIAEVDLTAEDHKAASLLSSPVLTISGGKKRHQKTPVRPNSNQPKKPKSTSLKKRPCTSASPLGQFLVKKSQNRTPETVKLINAPSCSTEKINVEQPMSSEKSTNVQAEKIRTDGSPKAKCSGMKELSVEPTGSVNDSPGVNVVPVGSTPKSAQSTKKQALAEERKRKAEKREKERLERERKKDEENKRKQEEKEKKEQERQQKLLDKEKEKAEKEQKRLEEKKAREEKELEKKMEKEAKQKEKEEKDKKIKEERLAKEEEKRKKDEEKQRIEDEKKRKLKKQQEILLKTVVITPAQNKTAPRIGVKFKDFVPKEGMVLCKPPRIISSADKENLLNLISGVYQSCEKCMDYKTMHPISRVCPKCNRNSLYMGELTMKDFKPGSSARTLDRVSKDLEILEENVNARMKAKLLQFHDQLRPAYYGTFRKKSKIVGPRKCFATDKELRDYDGESEDEWEEEPEGDECESDEEDKGESLPEEEQEEEDEWMVPHGYLSDGEGEGEDEMCADPESRRQRLAAKAEAWKAEKLDRKFVKLQPMIIGPIFEDDTVVPGEESLVKKLDEFKMIFPWGVPVETSYSRPIENAPPVPPLVAVSH